MLGYPCIGNSSRNVLDNVDITTGSITKVEIHGWSSNLIPFNEEVCAYYSGKKANP